MLPNEIDPGRAIVLAALILAVAWITHPPHVHCNVVNMPPAPEPKA